MANAPWTPSGYGEQTALFVPRLQDLGHELAIAANYGLAGAQMEIADGLMVYPAGDSNATVSTFFKLHKAEWVIALYDSWTLTPKTWDDDVKMALWAPIDHYPIPPWVLAVLQDPKVRPIAMSRDGQGWMRKFKLDPLYVPHGVDTRIFRPYPQYRAAARRALDVPEDAFLVGMVAANKGTPMFPRKSFPQAFEAFAHFGQRHDDAYMYVHTKAMPYDPSNGINLLELRDALQIPRKRLLFPPEHSWHMGIMDRLFMAQLYSAFDVLLNPSMGEGFGVPLIEAQACGVPVIASDHSAMTELTRSGWLVEGDPWWDPLQHSFAFCPSIASIEAKLEEAYSNRGNEKFSTEAVEFAQSYDADFVTKTYWVPALEALGAPREIGPLNGKSRQVRRAEERKAKA